MKDSRVLTLCEDLVRRWPTGLKQRSHQEPNPAVLDLGLLTFQNCFHYLSHTVWYFVTAA